MSGTSEPDRAGNDDTDRFDEVEAKLAPITMREPPSKPQRGRPKGPSLAIEIRGFNFPGNS